MPENSSQERFLRDRFPGPIPEYSSSDRFLRAVPQSGSSEQFLRVVPESSSSERFLRTIKSSNILFTPYRTDKKNGSPRQEEIRFFFTVRFQLVFQSVFSQFPAGFSISCQYGSPLPASQLVILRRLCVGWSAGPSPYSPERPMPQIAILSAGATYMPSPGWIS